ncbi:replication initiation and membrane attachment family protein [Virgibacillus sp. W0181]|uniref:replication initiation and membrane attachment family protein n=1 Tax=Virgibacillus sp. W0181 TaxID=3391581 RepID=UPI003F4744BE
MKYIGKILPVDGYYVLLRGNLPVDYASSLTHLYQPLIGMESVMLYQTLLHEITIQGETSIQTHHTLMNYLNIPLDQIYEARLKLEGIGLLTTYVNNAGTNRSYTYELQAPFAPVNFLQDAMLSELLFHHIGEKKYELLTRVYTPVPNEKKGENITATFQDVFQTFKPNFEIVNNQEEQPIQTTNTQQIDFSWMEQMLKQRMIPVKNVLTNENKVLISQMMLLYDLEPYEIDKSVLWAVSEDHVLDQKEFKDACHDLFKVKHNQASIQLVNNQKIAKEEEDKDIPQTKEQQLVQALQKMTPKQLLEDLSNGNHASEQDMKIIREVMTKQGLPPAVMNVLIHYVLLQSDMKLSKAYMEKIASHWSRSNLKTAKDAMEFAKKETNKRYQKSYTKNSNYNRQRTTGAVLPEWFKDRKKQKPSKKSVPPAPTNNNESEKEEVLALLRKHVGTNEK